MIALARLTAYANAHKLLLKTTLQGRADSSANPDWLFLVQGFRGLGFRGWDTLKKAGFMFLLDFSIVIQ